MFSFSLFLLKAQHALRFRLPRHPTIANHTLAQKNKDKGYLVLILYRKMD